MLVVVKLCSVSSAYVYVYVYMYMSLLGVDGCDNGKKDGFYQ